jgi:hypothetical protein
MKVQIEDVSPKLAKEWLALSKGNRRLNADYVLSLAVAMEQGGWVPEASEVVFDEAGALIDGHHRLSAVEQLGASVRMAVKRGVPSAARNVIDTGRARSMSDLLGMYRDVEYPTQRRAALNACVFLLVGMGSRSGHQPLIRTLDAYDSWMKHFREGIEWAVGANFKNGAPASSSRPFGVGPVLGAFAFAHKTNPQGVASFHERCIRGEGLTAGEAALTLRNFVLISSNGGTRTGMAASSRREVALKVLAAIKADLEGQRMAKLLINSHALPFFRAAYRGRAVDKLVEPWSDNEDSSNK